MSSLRTELTLKSGLFLVVFSWFSFTLYEFIINIIRGGDETSGFWILLTDTASGVGLGLRTAAGLIAVTSILLYFFGRFSVSESRVSLRWVLIFEAGYFAISFFPSAAWTIMVPNAFGNVLFTLLTNTLPCLVESVLIPVVLLKLFIELGPEKTGGNVVKWSLIAGVAYILVFWLNNTGNWMGAIMQKGSLYVSQYPVNLFSFALTTVGLFSLLLYTAYLAFQYSDAGSRKNLDFRGIGGIITALGLYFVTIYMLWIFFGSVGGWSVWYAWFLGHNVDLWVMSLPLVGLPLLVQEENCALTLFR